MPEPITELETALTPATNPKPMPTPTTETRHADTSILERKVTAQSDQVCEPTSIHEPVGCLEEREDDDHLPTLILPNPKPSLPLVSPKTSSLWIIHPPYLPSPTSSAKAEVPLLGPSALLLWALFIPWAPLLALPCSDPPWTSSSPAQPRCVASCVPPQTSVVSTRPVEQSIPPWLLAQSAPPRTMVHSAPPCFLIPSAPPWSYVTLPVPWTIRPPAALRLSTPSAPSGFAFPMASP